MRAMLPAAPPAEVVQILVRQGELADAKGTVSQRNAMARELSQAGRLGGITFSYYGTEVTIGYGSIYLP